MKAVVPQDSYSHFLLFNICNAYESVNLVLESVWIAVVREIWCHKNKVIFKSGVMDHLEIFSLTLLKSWSWVSSKVQITMFFVFRLVS